MSWGRARPLSAVSSQITEREAACAGARLRKRSRGGSEGAVQVVLLPLLLVLLFVIRISAQELNKEDDFQYDTETQEKCLQSKSVSASQARRGQVESAKRLPSSLLANHHRLLQALRPNSRRKDPKIILEERKTSGHVLAKGRGSQQSKCEVLVKRLKSLLLESEEQVDKLQEDAVSLSKLAARTMPKGLHCLSLQLTIQYHNRLGEGLSSSEGGDERKFEDPELYHYVIYSENVLAASVVVKSTLFHVKEPHKHVFHILTDGLNYPALKMWFGSSLRGNAAVVEVKNVVGRNMGRVSSLGIQKRPWKFWKHAKAEIPSANMETGQFGLQLSKIFPSLDKVLFLDDDIVVRKDLTGLWKQSLESKIYGAVNPTSTMDAKFSKQFGEFWQSCMSIVDLAEWRKLNQTEVNEVQNQTHFIWTFGKRLLIAPYDNVHTFDDLWPVLNLIDLLAFKDEEVLNAAAIHYCSYLKPWLDLSMGRFKSLWTRFVNYDHPVLKECNINK